MHFIILQKYDGKRSHRRIVMADNDLHRVQMELHYLYRRAWEGESYYLTQYPTEEEAQKSIDTLNKY